MKNRKRKYIYIFIAIVIIGAIAYFATNRKKPLADYSTVKASRGTLVQSVTETGTVKSQSELKLNFLSAGKVQEIFIKVGDKVAKDQKLAELDSSALKIKQNEILAAVGVAQANLNKLLAGATREEVNIGEKNVSQADSAHKAAVIALENTKKTVAENISQAEKKLFDLEDSSAGTATPLEQAVKSAETSLENTKKTYDNSFANAEDNVLNSISDKLGVVNTALDMIDRIINDFDHRNYLSVRNPAYLTAAKGDYNDSLVLEETARVAHSAAIANKSGISAAADRMNEALDKTLSALNNTLNALNNTVSASLYTQDQINADKTIINGQITLTNAGLSSLESAEQNLANAQVARDTNISSAELSLAQARASLSDAVIAARNAVSTAKVSGNQTISAAESQVESAKKSLDTAKAQLEKILAPVSSHDISLVSNQLKQAQSSLESINRQIADLTISAPIAGTVTEINYKIGETASQASAAIVLLGSDSYEIETDISEADISKIKVDNPVEITFDAFGEEQKYSGKVYFIEPAETRIQDVIYYKVKISLDSEGLHNSEDNDKIIKSGMTANAVIATAQKENVIFVPSRAILQKDGKKIVRVLGADGQAVEKEVEIGLSGDNGQIEIISGVSEGEDVVTSVKETK